MEYKCSIELNGRGKMLRVLLTVAKVFGLLFLLYSFICSLDVLSNAFRLVGGKTTGKINQSTNPFDFYDLAQVNRFTSISD